MSLNTSLVLSSNKAQGARPNTSGFVGVAYDKSRSQWLAYVQLSTKKRKNLGRHPTVEAAAAVRAAFIAEHGTASPVKTAHEAA